MYHGFKSYTGSMCNLPGSPAVANAIYSAKPNAPKFILAQIVVHIIGYVFTIILFVLFLNSVFYAKVRFSSYEADAALKAATSETYLLTFIPLPVDVLLMLPIVIYRRAVVRANLNTVKNVEN
ncbi:hypothetical protein HK099_002943 [Clydaea vesicula]|uniref:Uncharacterized protein n=1 Tax=Clydaea vesicula TaxID=447962 RepID=A0AAD5U3U4_9FUNG|nr:hypothetical protein HK099_002943 [Clydaea vesicula]